jgi:type I restriction enzyme S subunit
MSELPGSWHTAPLEAVAAVVRGVTYKKADASSAPTEGYLPILRATNIQGGLSLDSEMVYVPDRYIRAEQRMQRGDILVAASSGSASVVGKSGELRQDWTGGFGAFCSVIRPSPHLARGYLAHFVASPPVRNVWRALAQGTSINNLKASDVAKTEVPIAPVEEQERIVAAVEEELSRLDAGVAALERIRANLKSMRASVLQAAVTGRLVAHTQREDVDATLQLIARERRAKWAAAHSKPYKQPAEPEVFPFELPDHYRIASLEALTDPMRVICYGILMPKDDVCDGVPYVRVKDLKNWSIDLGQLRRTSSEIAAQYARASLEPDDLLLAIRGSYGRAAIVPAELAGGNITQDTARIAAHPAIDRRYLLYYVGGSVANRYYQRVARGVAVKGVNIGDLRKLPVPVPPRVEQIAIADEVERQFTILDHIEAVLEQHLRHGANLRASILSAAFSGDLVPQGPSEESASVLLKRIAAERASDGDGKPTRKHRGKAAA